LTQSDFLTSLKFSILEDVKDAQFSLFDCDKGKAYSIFCYLQDHEYSANIYRISSDVHIWRLFYGIYLRYRLYVYASAYAISFKSVEAYNFESLQHSRCSNVNFEQKMNL